MKPKPSRFPEFLALVMLLFIGILVYVWVEAKRANPIMLDEKGNPRNGTAAQVQKPR